MESTEIVKFNDVDIECPKNDSEIYVAVRPICQALGIAPNGQIEQLKKGLNGMSTDNCICLSVGMDGKQREMFCLNLKDVLFWLLYIDVERVNESARENLTRYKIECRDVLYNHFIGCNQSRANILKNKAYCESKLKEMNRNWKESEEYTEYQDLKARLRECNGQLNTIDESLITNQLELF